MELTIRHLSGSRAGEVQNFNSDSVRIGRNPTNQVSFDPEKDRIVSGSHAELVARNDSWMLRDLGSSNGTYINGEKVSERTIRPGEIVQFGKNGPQIQIEYPASVSSATVVGLPTGEARMSPPVVEGRTVMMMMDGGAASAAAATPHVQPAVAIPGATAKKKGSPALKIILALVVVFALLGIAFVGAVMVAGRGRAKQKAAIAAATKQKAAERDRIASALKQQQQQLAQTQATIEKAKESTSTSATPAAPNPEISDLERQLQESQMMIQNLSQQLQQKNDEISTIQTRPAQVREKIKYVPVPTQTPSNPQTTRSTTSPQRPQKPASTSPTTQQQVATTPALPPMNLTVSKHLKTRILVNALPPEIPPAQMPGGTANELANTVSRALVSTGNFVLDPKGVASISVAVTNFQATNRTNVNLKSAGDTASKVGGLFGQKIPGSPVNVTSVSYDAAMSARFTLYDKVGQPLNEFDTNASAKNTKSKVSLDPLGVPFGQIFGSDTAVGDVARKVVADGVQGLLNQLKNVTTIGFVTSHTKNEVKLDVGRSANVEVGDVFDVVDGGRPMGRIRITSITPTNAIGEVLAGTEKFAGKEIRYAGREGASAFAEHERAVLITRKTQAFDGPGSSFHGLRQINPGTRLKLLFAVGTWAKVSDGGSTFWVPLINATIET